MKKVRLILIVFFALFLSSCMNETINDNEKEADYFPDITVQKKYKHAKLFVSNHMTQFYYSGIVTWNFNSRFVRKDTTITIIDYTIVDTLYGNKSITNENGSFEIYEDKDHNLTFSKLPPILYGRLGKYPRYVINGPETSKYDALIFKKNTGLIHAGVYLDYGGYNVLDLIK